MTQDSNPGLPDPRELASPLHPTISSGNSRTLCILSHKSLLCWPSRGDSQEDPRPQFPHLQNGASSDGSAMWSIYVTSWASLRPAPTLSVSYLLAVGDLVLPHAALLWRRDAPGHAQRGSAAALQLHLGGLWAGQRVGKGCEEPPGGGGRGQPDPVPSIAQAF